MKSQGSGGSSPFSGTIFSKKKRNPNSSERLLNTQNLSFGTISVNVPVNKKENICDERGMQTPLDVIVGKGHRKDFYPVLGLFSRACDKRRLIFYRN